MNRPKDEPGWFLVGRDSSSTFVAKARNMVHRTILPRGKVLCVPNLEPHLLNASRHLAHKEAEAGQVYRRP